MTSTTKEKLNKGVVRGAGTPNYSNIVKECQQMYLQNKYTRWYYNIIHRAQTRTISGYIEKHHIIPSSLGGKNSIKNIARVTPREHFVCHLLLTKMTTGNNLYKMKHALSMLMNVKNIGNGRYIPSSRIYEYVKKCHLEAIRETWTEEKRKLHSAKIKNIVKGRKHSESTIQKFKNKIWTEKAIQNRLDNCLRNAASRKGIKNPEHGQRVFAKYVHSNKEVILQIWNLYDQGLNRRQISNKLSISWDRVNVAINKRAQIDVLL